jgi:extradiol dioxygenase family protein
MTIRVARHTNDLARIGKFYIELLGFELLGEFKDHNHYDGIFIGLKDAHWHLEFTKSNTIAQHHFDEDDLMVFYPSTMSAYQMLIQRIKAHGIEQVVAKNPYWRENGTTIVDPDGYRIVISPLKAQIS